MLPAVTIFVSFKFTLLRAIHIVPFVTSSVLASEDVFDNYRQGKKEILLNMPR